MEADNDYQLELNMGVKFPPIRERSESALLQEDEIERPAVYPFLPGFAP